MHRYRFIFLAVVLCHLAFASWATHDARTTYPIVLIHGFFGFGEGMSWYARYFGDIPDVLRNHGAIVYIADVSQANTIKKRGEELYQQLVSWGHNKYNLIGHSHGGLDARYVLETYPALVSSVTTIGTPHRGSKVADYVYDKISAHQISRVLAYQLGNMLGRTIGIMSGTAHPQNVKKALHGLTTEGLREFNQSYQAGLGAEYCSEGPHEYLGRKLYSWGSSGESRDLRNDILSRLFKLTSRAFDDDEENDGLVAICSMKFGKWLDVELEGHHLIPVCGVISRVSEDQVRSAQEIFVEHARRLRNEKL